MRARAALLAGAAALVTLAGCATGSAIRPTPSAGPTTPASVTATPPRVSASPSRLTAPDRSSPVLPQLTPSSTRLPSAAQRPAPANPLPLPYGTGSATQLITVTAASARSTDATLQTWTRSGDTWVKVDAAVHAYLGRSGTSTDKHEGDGTTPAGSFTLTQAFGYRADPGTALQYAQTTPADWWISQPGPLYNTHQRCTSGTDGDGCGYAAPSEHLYYTQPNYQYALVIDYNTSPVRADAGSAVFLHVQTGKPTSGCVSIELTQLTRILRWLQPAAHPRILIGTT